MSPMPGAAAMCAYPSDMAAPLPSLKALAPLPVAKGIVVVARGVIGIRIVIVGGGVLVGIGVIVCIAWISYAAGQGENQTQG